VDRIHDKNSNWVMLKVGQTSPVIIRTAW